MKKLILLLVIISTTACVNEQKLPEDFDYGSIDNGVYTNNYFKMRFPFDDNWNVQTQKEMKAISDTGAELLNNEETKRNVKASEINNANLFSAFRYKEDFDEAYNYSIVIVAENTKMFPHVKRGSDYLKEAQKIVSQTAIDYEFDDAYTSLDIGGKNFDVMNVKGNYMGVEFAQKYMTAIIDGFSFSIIISYQTDEQLLILENLVDGISFNSSKPKKKAA